MWRDDIVKSISSGILQIVKSIHATILIKDNYKHPIEFEALEDKTGYFTLNSENNKDYIVLGNVIEEITNVSELKAIKNKYPKIGIISTVQDDTNIDVEIMKKWQVLATYQ